MMMRKTLAVVLALALALAALAVARHEAEVIDGDGTAAVTAAPSQPAQAVSTAHGVAEPAASTDRSPAAPVAAAITSSTIVRDDRPTRIDHSAALFDIYERGSSTTDPSVAVQAERAAIECDGLLAWHAAFYGVLAGGGVTDPPQPEVSQARRAAIGEMLRRCSGFERLAPGERRAAISRLDARARELGAPEKKLQQHGVQALAAAEAAQIIESTSAANFESALQVVAALAENLALRAGLDASTAQRISGDSAFLALCDISHACAPDSLRSLVECVTGGRCATDGRDGWQDGHDATEQALITQYRAHLVETIRARDWAALGLR